MGIDDTAEYDGAVVGAARYVGIPLLLTRSCQLIYISGFWHSASRVLPSRGQWRADSTDCGNFIGIDDTAEDDGAVVGAA